MRLVFADILGLICGLWDALFGVFGIGSVAVICVGRDDCSSALQLETNLVLRFWI